MMIGRQLTGKDHSFFFDNMKYCTHNQGKAVEAGGKWIVSNHGRSRRWICAACNERRNVK